MNNNFKQELQEREFLALKDKHRVILKWATGCGKSKMAIDLINYQAMNMLVHTKPVKVLFVVGERAHINNWQNEFDRWHLRIDRVSTDVICYNSLKKVKDTVYDIIVLDECHHAFSPTRLPILEEMSQYNIYINSVYLLSATLSSAKVDQIEELFGKFTISTVSLKDAISNDILPDPKVYVVEMELDDSRIDQEIVGRKGDKPHVVNWENRNKYKFKNVPYVIRCTQKQKNIWFTNEMEYWKQRYENSHNTFHHNYWVNYGSQRKRFLGELKTAAVKKLIDSLPKKKRFVCFCASVNQANMLDCVNTISSKRPAKSNQLIIDKFNAKKIDHIYAVGMITEGMNLTDIQLGIIVQLDGKERLFVQKIGRVLRADAPKAVIFYFKDTQDENYLKGALENIDSKFVQYINTKQLATIKL